MKSMKRLMVLTLSLLLILAVLTPAAMADALYGVIKTPTKNGSVNLRAKAGVTQSIIGYAMNGDEVEVVYKGNTWHKVRLIKNGKTGWMYGRYLRFTEAPAPDSATGVRVSGTVAQVMTKYPASKVNLRYAADTRYAILGKYSRGTRMEVLDETDGWYQVQIAGSDTIGWMSKDYVSLGLEARTTGRVNLRRGPGTGYTAIRVLDRGQAVTVTWVDEKWSKVQAGNESGYISNSYYVFK